MAMKPYDSQGTPVSPNKKAPAALLAVSLLVILGIYGFNIILLRNEALAHGLDPRPVIPQRATTPAPVEHPTDAEPSAATPPDAIAEVPETTPPETPAPVDPPDVVAAVEPPPTEPTPPPFDEEAFLQGGWKSAATEALTAFLNAKTPEEKLAHVLHPDRVRTRLARVEPGALALKPEEFTPVDLSDDDHREGIFLMMRQAYADAASPDAHCCYAFFRRTDDSLKLDWEVFSQTRDLAFLRFIEKPQPGTTGVFRVFITEDVPPANTPKRNYRTYFITDLANFNNVIQVRVTHASPTGKILAAVNFTEGNKRIMKNATVELRWTDSPEKPTLELARFICWKFLDLGGREIEP